MWIFLHIAGNPQKTYICWVIFNLKDADMSDDDKNNLDDETPKLTLLEGGKDADGEKPKQAKRKLTAKQERFLAGLIRGQSQYDAYCAAYNAKGMKRSAIDTEAWRLAAHPEIARRLHAHHASIERAASASALSPRGRVPLMGRERMALPSHSRSSSGDELTTAPSGACTSPM